MARRQAKRHRENISDLPQLLEVPKPWLHSQGSPSHLHQIWQHSNGLSIALYGTSTIPQMNLMPNQIIGSRSINLQPPPHF